MMGRVVQKEKPVETDEEKLPPMYHLAVAVVFMLLAGLFLKILFF